MINNSFDLESHTLAQNSKWNKTRLFHRKFPHKYWLFMSWNNHLIFKEIHLERWRCHKLYIHRGLFDGIQYASCFVFGKAFLTHHCHQKANLVITKGIKLTIAYSLCICQLMWKVDYFEICEWNIETGNKQALKVSPSYNISDWNCIFSCEQGRW